MSRKKGGMSPIIIPPPFPPTRIPFLLIPDNFYVRFLDFSVFHFLQRFFSFLALQDPFLDPVGPVFVPCFSGYFGHAFVFVSADGQMGPKNTKNLAKSEKPKNQETLHKSGPGLIKMGFWQVGWVGNNSWTHPPFFSRHLVPQNLRNIMFVCLLFSQYWTGSNKKSMISSLLQEINSATILSGTASKSYCH